MITFWTSVATVVIPVIYKGLGTLFTEAVADEIE